METTIPFSGFYSSVHDQEMDSQLEYMFSDDNGDINSDLLQHGFDAVDWGAVRLAYAQNYVEDFAIEFELETVKFKLMSSPKYYNFETDRIFAEIELSEVKHMFKAVPTETLKQAVKDNFTSYDGFTSFYSNDLTKWPTELKDWDHNQVGTLLAVFIRLQEPEFSQVKEYFLIDNAGEYLYNLIWENMKDGDRLYKIREYLEKRELRN